MPQYQKPLDLLKTYTQQLLEEETKRGGGARPKIEKGLRVVVDFVTQVRSYWGTLTDYMKKLAENLKDANSTPQTPQDPNPIDPNPKILTEQIFDQTIRGSTKPVFVNFSTSW